ncbi:hypothetical protein A0128_11220 [Leptospira tipperaryensis]|uniref:Uncharacterized protein n=1 Tax=Leptospira tipperaryensis TaxID=2564040 RepID=A0A1D7UXQ3_9LEPT|nr:hypothetical protein A0128_11220 [Leptospira tipperaryensis]
MLKPQDVGTPARTVHSVRLPESSFIAKRDRVCGNSIVFITSLLRVASASFLRFWKESSIPRNFITIGLKVRLQVLFCRNNRFDGKKWT